MAVMNIDKYLNGTVKCRDRIYRVGVELEGGWAKVPNGVTIGRDGSVSVTAPDGSRLNVGELASEILEVSKVPTFLKTYYPSHVNPSCGLHVHMSFLSAKHYAMLMTPQFQETVIEYLKRWGKSEGLPKEHQFWPRIRGENTYCKLEYHADAQAAAENKNFNHNIPGTRYTAINYSYKQHSTVECRVLPMFADAETAISAVQQVFKITNACLVYLRRKEEKIQAEVKFSADEPRWSSNIVIAPEVYPSEVEEFAV